MTRRIFAVDIGGTHLKASVVAADGTLLADPVRTDSPATAGPAAFARAIAAMASGLPAFDAVALGFPGVVRDGCVRTAPLFADPHWAGFALCAELERLTGKPCRMANDADVHGLAVIEGHGLEMVVTLGTGFGTSLYADGRLCPHLELAHHPFLGGRTYNECVGEAARRACGDEEWLRRVHEAIRVLRVLTNFDRLHVGGGNARLLTGPLPADVRVVDNVAGIVGGAFLWRDGA